MPLSPTSFSRRQFIKTAAAAGAAVMAPCVIPGRALGLDGVVAPSERITMAGIGMGGRATQAVLPPMLAQPDVQFLAVCDVRASRRIHVKNIIDNKNGNKDCTVYRDLRELLARKDIDGVLIGTGDRWHAPASMMAAEAGKDIYSEKPCAMTIELCDRLAETMRRCGRVFQGGTQRRNIGNFRMAAEMARTGKIGKLKTLYAAIYSMSETHEWLPAQPEPPKDEVDWNLWLGTAPWRPYNAKYVNSGWRGYYDFDSGARLLDWGAHTVDICQWANGADGTMPIEFEPAGPGNRLRARYANGVELIMCQSGWSGTMPGWHNLGSCSVRFEGENGWLETGDSGKLLYSRDGSPAEQKQFERGYPVNQHVRDFFNCVKTRQQPACNADVIRTSHIACHAAYISWLLNRKLQFDPAKEEFIGEDEANRMRSRPERNWQAV